MPILTAAVALVEPANIMMAAMNASAARAKRSYFHTYYLDSVEGMYLQFFFTVGTRLRLRSIR